MGEARYQRCGRSQTNWLVAFLASSVLGALCTPASAMQKFGPLELSGNVESQDILRDSSPERYQFIQQRNTVRIRVDYDWLQNGKIIDRFAVPWAERSKLFLLYRGVYDGFYDIAPGDNQHGQTRYDDLVGGSIKNVPAAQRTADKWENTLREAYVDLRMKYYPVSFRVGRQQVIWGEADQFRLMDIWNPLDTSWHFQQEQSWDNIRIPLWLAKGLWDIGTVGPLSNTFLEVVYNPFDFQPGIKSAFLPRPWGLPFPNPLRNGQIQRIDATNLTLTPSFDLDGTSLTHGDFKRNPQDASEVGTRFHFVAPHGIELSANYLYGRARGVGAAPPFAVKINSLTADLRGTSRVGQYQPDNNNPATVYNVFPINVDAEVKYPYMHIFGLTGNYADEDYTQAVARFEMAYAMGEPYNTTDPSKLVPVNSNRGVIGSAPFGYTRENVWAGMVGFDRPTWIRLLNPKATWFLSGQIFWSYIDGHSVDHLVGNAPVGDDPYFGPIGHWVSGPYQGQTERQQNGAAVGNGDQMRQWEHLITFAAQSFYRAGTVVPFIAEAWDPVNDNCELTWYIDYFHTNNFIISPFQKFFWTYGSKAPSNDPWYAGGRFTRRDETGIKVTYQF